MGAEQTIGDAGKPEFCQALRLQLAALLEGERDPVANA